MKKFIKRASVVALSALMIGSAVASFSGCGTSAHAISVYVFAGTEDQQTNTDMLNAWADSYNAKLKEKYGENTDKQVTVTPTFQSDTTKYFTTLNNQNAAGTAPDVFYVSPKYVKAWAKAGYVLDLTDYIDFSTTDTYDINEVFGDAIGFYGYDSKNNVVGASISYNSTSKKFENDAGDAVGVYGLPKDYSSFGLGYNNNFFTDELKKAYESSGAADEDKASKNGAVIQNAATGAASAGVINIGIPTTYYPYNFYVYNSYDEALAAGDSIAEASNYNKGYTVTIPGYPNDTYDTGKADTDDTPYEDNVGNIVYTYAELSAVSWAISYYNYKYAGRTVFGNDQYEGTLYLLPWLAGNDADYINSQPGTSADGSSVESFHSVNSGTYTKADGTVINYGVDNEEFIESYAAFAAYGSDWNANSYYCGAKYEDGSLINAGGYLYFKSGDVIFYGVGTWDAPGFADSSQDVLSYAVMPEPVSEDYALYSRIKDAKYEQQVYMNNGTADSDGKVALNTAVPTGYTESQIQANQNLRQDQWAGRMDSVGYGVNGKYANASEDEKWIAEACADCVAYMTVNKESQVTLTYSGSQLPNYADMCSDYKDLTGEFAGSITTDDMDTFKTYYACAVEMATYGTSASTDKEVLIKDWMSEYNASHGTQLVYNEAYADSKMGTVANYITAYRVLRMIALNHNSRNLCTRMTSGTNGVKDSCMYTFNSDWINVFGDGETKQHCLLAYNLDKSAILGYFSGTAEGDASNYIGKISKTWIDKDTVCTPWAYCKGLAQATQEKLQLSIDDENTLINAATGN